MNREIIMNALFGLLTAPPLVFNFTADTTTGSITLTNISNTSGLMAGLPVAGDGLALDTMITATSPAVTLSLPAIADRTASAMTQGFQTTTRRLNDPMSEQDMPALYLVDINEIHPGRASTGAPMIEINCDALIFTKVGADRDAIPAATLNNLIDGIERAIYPTPITFRQILGTNGILYCRIEGEIEKDPGHNGSLAGARVPIKIAVAQSENTFTLSAMRR